MTTYEKIRSLLAAVSIEDQHGRLLCGGLVPDRESIDDETRDAMDARYGRASTIDRGEVAYWVVPRVDVLAARTELAVMLEIDKYL